MNKLELCQILTKWLTTFQVDAKFATVKDLSDGVAIAQALHEIAPEWFTSNWLSKIKTDAGENWRLKVSNLKKVLEKILDFYQEAFSQNLPEAVKPDVVKIGDGCDPTELARLLQLVLGCAVNCENKQEYIRRIMCMEENDQRVMMECIQELDAVGGGALSFSASLSLVDPHVEALVTQLTAANAAKEKADERIHQLSLQVNLLQEEKSALHEENQKILDQLHSRFEPGGGPLTRQVEALKDELSKLKEEGFKLEMLRDDYRLKLEMQDRELVELRCRVEELSRAASEARSLKDELDVLRETADKVEKYEATLQSYKKKLEEAGDTKRELKLLEGKIQHYIQTNMELEEELKKTTALKTQVEIYKKQVSELHDQLTEETKRADRLAYENKMGQDKLSAALREKERLLVERDSLKEANEEMKCAAYRAGSEGAETALDLGSVSEGLVSVSELRQKIARLEHENNMLRLAQKEREEDSLSVVQNLLEDARAQADKMWKENREANQRIIQLEAELRELQSGSGNSSDSSGDLQQLKRDKMKLVRELEEKEQALSEAKQVMNVMTEKLTAKENEVVESEEKFKRYVEKARSVVKSIEPTLELSSTEASLLRSQLVDSQRSLKEKEKELEETKKIMELESKLMATAWHDLGAKKQREAVEQRLASLGHGGSFLARQRQPVSRRLQTFNSSH
uniref:Protein hook n=3 Tax=Lygus hesperus TaxID=30085 RepID=A0A0K8SQC9_LYGHE